MERKRTSALFALMFLVLVGIMDYPFLVRIFNEQNQSAIVVEYNELAKEMAEAEKEAYLKAAREYNQSLTTGVAQDMETAFLEAAGNEAGGVGMDDAYAGLLKIQENGVMAVVEIPKINISLPVYHGTSEESLKEGAGHLEGSSLPVGGASTHACIAAHRGLVTKKMFTDLDQIEEGDLFYISVLGETYAYQVYETAVVEPEELEPLKIQTGEDLVTLITCTPYGVNSHRIYVHGTRVPYEETEEKAAGMREAVKNYWWIILTVVLLVWMYVLLYRDNQRNG